MKLGTTDNLYDPYFAGALWVYRAGPSLERVLSTDLLARIPLRDLIDYGGTWLFIVAHNRDKAQKIASAYFDSPLSVVVIFSHGTILQPRAVVDETP
jgi:hypothetical protein